MRWKQLLGGLAVTGFSIAAFVLVLAPPIPTRPNYAAKVEIDCFPTKGALAVFDVIPDNFGLLSSYADINVAIDHNRSCTRLRLTVHKSVEVAVLNTQMVADSAVGPELKRDALKPVVDLSPTAFDTNDFAKYDIDLERLGKDRWVGLGIMTTAPRSSFETFDADISFRLDAAVNPLQRDGGKGGEVWNVGSGEALTRTYHYTVSYKNTIVAQYREIVLILFGALITAGLGITAGALRSTKANHST